MRPLKLSLAGEFWDSQIYSGVLYLFGRDGSVTTISWEALVASLDVAINARLAVVAGFLRGDLLYNKDIWPLLHDPEVRRLVLRKFDALSDSPLAISKDGIARHQTSKMDNPFPFPHSDSEIYLNEMYVTGPAGLWSAVCGHGADSGIGLEPRRMFDGALLGVEASFNTVAAAGGDEGLFEFSVDPLSYNGWREPRRLASSGPCEDCNWIYQSVYAASHHGGFLADYHLVTRKDEDNKSHRDREFNRIVNGSEVFGTSGYSWGAGDKICCATNGSVSVARYSKRGKSPREPQVQVIGRVEATNLGEEIVSAGLASFGAVVEYDSGLTVYGSDGGVFSFPGEPVNWRVFPRSKYYGNHLHLIYDDRLEVLSFNHDYSIPQEMKIIGTVVKGEGSRPSIDVERLMDGRVEND